jgi:hypothetical protein
MLRKPPRQDPKVLWGESNTFGWKTRRRFFAFRP